MAVKGDVDAVVSRSALNEIIIYMNQYHTQVTEKVTMAQGICQRMLDEESLKGGDGEQIREGFQEISKGLSNLSKSIDKIVRALNKNLGATMEASQNKYGAAAKDKATAAANKTGVLAHKE